jgi:hypothetical protein
MNFTMDVAGQFSVLLLLSMIGLALNWIVIAVRQRVLFWDASQKLATRRRRKGDLRGRMKRAAFIIGARTRRVLHAAQAQTTVKVAWCAHGVVSGAFASLPRWAGSPRTASRWNSCRCRVRPVREGGRDKDVWPALDRAARDHPAAGREGQNCYTAYQANIYGIAVPGKFRSRPLPT